MFNKEGHCFWAHRRSEISALAPGSSTAQRLWISKGCHQCLCICCPCPAIFRETVFAYLRIWCHQSRPELAFLWLWLVFLSSFISVRYLSLYVFFQKWRRPKHGKSSCHLFEFSYISHISHVVFAPWYKTLHCLRTNPASAK